MEQVKKGDIVTFSGTVYEKENSWVLVKFEHTGYIALKVSDIKTLRPEVSDEKNV